MCRRRLPELLSRAQWEPQRNTQTSHHGNSTPYDANLPLEYVEDSMKFGEVIRHLREWHLKDCKWNKRLFIVTGETVAKGAKIIKSYTKPSGIHSLQKPWSTWHQPRRQRALVERSTGNLINPRRRRRISDGFCLSK